MNKTAAIAVALAMSTSVDARECAIVGASNTANYGELEVTDISTALTNISNMDESLSCNWTVHRYYPNVGLRLVDLYAQTYNKGYDAVVVDNIKLGADTVPQIGRHIKHNGWPTRYNAFIKYPHNGILDTAVVNAYNRLVDKSVVAIGVEYPDSHQRIDDWHGSSKSNYAVAMEIYARLIEKGF